MLLHNTNPSQYQQQYRQQEPEIINQMPLELQPQQHHQRSPQHRQQPPQQQFLPTSNSYSLATTTAGFQSNLAMKNPENYHQIQNHHRHQHHTLQHPQNYPDLVIEQAVSSHFKIACLLHLPFLFLTPSQCDSCRIRKLKVSL
jgi:hypothetical protein